MRVMQALVPLTALFAFCAFAGADNPEVIAVSADDIRADAGALPENDMVSTGQPDAKMLQTIADAGFVAVIDLRTDGEDRGIDERGFVEQLGMRYISLPVAGGRDMTFENAAELDRLLSEADGQVLLHCGSGNRVGALVALRASLHGASQDEALAAGKAAGLTRSESVVRERLSTVEATEPAGK